MRTLRTFLVFVGLLSLLGTTWGCSALFNSGPQAVDFTSEPSGAEVWVDGELMGKAPIVIELSKKDMHKVTFKMAGKSDRTYILNRMVKPGYVILDVVFGLVPVIVDAAAGTWYGLDNSKIHGVLTDEEKSELLQKARENVGMR